MSETTNRYVVVCSCGFESVFLLPPTIVRGGLLLRFSCAQCGKIIHVQEEAAKATTQEGNE